MDHSALLVMDSRFCTKHEALKELGILLLPLDGMLVHHRVIPNILFSSPNSLLVNIYTPVPSISTGKKGKVCIRAKWPIRPVLIPGFRSMKRLGVFLLPPGWDASPSQGYPQQ